ncbi:MAG: hypothetical protein K5986_09085 [Clostridium sp.]|nr:hypothetical protein [Clostridium sp.]
MFFGKIISNIFGSNSSNKREEKSPIIVKKNNGFDNITKYVLKGNIGEVIVNGKMDKVFSYNSYDAYDSKYMNEEGYKRAIREINYIEDLFKKRGYIVLEKGIVKKQNCKFRFASIYEHTRETTLAASTDVCIKYMHRNDAIKFIDNIEKEFKKAYNDVVSCNEKYNYVYNYYMHKKDETARFGLKEPVWEKVLPDRDNNLIKSLRAIYHGHAGNAIRYTDKVLTSPAFIYIKKKILEKLVHDNRMDIIRKFNSNFKNEMFSGGKISVFKVSNEDRFICFVAEHTFLEFDEFMDDFFEFIRDKIVGEYGYYAEEALADSDKKYIEELNDYIKNDIEPNIGNKNIERHKYIEDAFEESSFNYLLKNKDKIIRHISSLITKYSSSYGNIDDMIEVVLVETIMYFNKLLEDWVVEFTNNNINWLKNICIYTSIEEFIAETKRNVIMDIDTTYKCFNLRTSTYEGWNWHAKEIRNLVKYCMANIAINVTVNKDNDINELEFEAIKYYIKCQCDDVPLYVM